MIGNPCSGPRRSGGARRPPGAASRAPSTSIATTALMLAVVLVDARELRVQQLQRSELPGRRSGRRARSPTAVRCSCLSSASPQELLEHVPGDPGDGVLVAVRRQASAPRDRADGEHAPPAGMVEQDQVRADAVVHRAALARVGDQDLLAAGLVAVGEARRRRQQRPNRRESPPPGRAGRSRSPPRRSRSRATGGRRSARRRRPPRRPSRARGLATPGRTGAPRRCPAPVYPTPSQACGGCAR